MYHKIFSAPIVGLFFKLAKAIPIAPAHEDKELMQTAFDKIAHELSKGEVICIFPEGKLTPNGEIGQFKKGIERIIQRTPVPIVPIALKGLWGSWFSRYNGSAMTGLPKKIMAKVSIVAGKPIAPEQASAEVLYNRVSELSES